MAEPTVRDIMDPDAPSVTPDVGVEDVVRRFAELEVPALPVVNDGGRCVGIVTEEDLVIADEQGDLHIPHYIELFGGLVMLPDSWRHIFDPMKGFEERLQKAAAATVADLMTEDPVTIDVDRSAQDAAHIVVSKGHSRLPVVEHGRYVGLVTRADILRALRDLER
jgi:CBS domain-containing protein